MSQQQDRGAGRRIKSQLSAIAEAARESLNETHTVRERALRLSREITRNSANSIRATHRGEFEQAEALVEEVANLVRDVESLLADHPEVFYAGYVEDALKEFTEAKATLAFVQGEPLPTPEELGVSVPSYLNGLAEAASEMRRYILDGLRRDDFSRCEELLDVMDEVYTVMTSMDFPDAVTRGLRRNTDMLRGVLERTRGDLTVALRQRRLEQELASFHEKTSR